MTKEMKFINDSELNTVTGGLCVGDASPQVILEVNLADLESCVIPDGYSIFKTVQEGDQVTIYFSQIDTLPM